MKSKKWWIHDWTIVIVLIAISLVPRLILLLNVHSYSSDGVSYLSTALYLRDPALVGEVPKRIYFILFPSLVLIFNTFLHNLALSGRLIDILAGMAIPPLVFILGKRIFGLLPSFIASVFCALNYDLVWQSTEIRGDILFALATLLTILVFEKINWRNPRVRDSLLLALVMGIAQLARTNGLMYLLVVFPIWFRWLRKGIIPFGSWFWRSFVPFAVLFALLASIPHLLLAIRGEERPSMFIYTYLDGNITASGDRETTFFKLNADATEYQFIEDMAHADFGAIIETLPQLPKKYLHNLNYCFMLFFGPTIDVMLKLSLILIPFLFYILYYWGEIKFPSGAKRLLFWAWPSFFLLPAINVEDLYFLPLIPILMLFLAWLIVTASSLGWISRWRPWVIIILVLIVIVPMSVKTVGEIRDEAKHANPYVPAGEWIKNNTPDSTLIMARNPEIFFHALRRGFRMPSEDLNRTLIFALNRNIDYIIFGPIEIDKRNELFFEAYDEVNRLGSKSRLKVVHTVEMGESVVYILQLVPENFKVKSLPGID